MSSPEPKRIGWPFLLFPADPLSAAGERKSISISRTPPFWSLSGLVRKQSGPPPPTVYALPFSFFFFWCGICRAWTLLSLLLWPIFFLLFMQGGRRPRQPGLEACSDIKYFSFRIFPPFGKRSFPFFRLSRDDRKPHPLSFIRVTTSFKSLGARNRSPPRRT